MYEIRRGVWENIQVGTGGTPEFNWLGGQMGSFKEPVLSGEAWAYTLQCRMHVQLLYIGSINAAFLRN